MNTNRHRASLTTATTMLLALLVLILTGDTTRESASPARPALTIAAAVHTSAAPASTQAGRATITTSGQDEQERDQPGLSYNQAVRLMRTVTPGLVDITTTLSGGDGKAGTGIVLSSKGVVMTDYHVVSGATALSVHDLGNGLDYGARILGVDRVHDIAVLALAGATHLHTARLGGLVSIGTVVASIGNAGGLGDPSLGAGPVVALNQSITSTTGQTRPLTGLIEATNGVEPGESGGPMVSASGAVVGVTVATQLGGDGQPNGHGYAVPVTIAMAAVHRILART
jgi:S1-C subfamily serine protease